MRCSLGGGGVGGQDDFVQQHTHARRGSLPLDRAVDIGLGDPVAPDKAVAHNLPPYETCGDEITKTFRLDPGLAQGGDKFLARQVGAAGEFGHPLRDRFGGDGNAHAARGFQLQPLVDQRVQRLCLGVARRIEQRQHARPLVPFERGDHTIVHLRDGGEQVLRRHWYGACEQGRSQGCNPCPAVRGQDGHGIGSLGIVRVLSYFVQTRR